MTLRNYVLTMYYAEIRDGARLTVPSPFTLPFLLQKL